MDHFELNFAFSDFTKLLKRKKKTIALFALSGALICLLVAVTRPVNYFLQSSFRDKGKMQANIHSSLTEMFFSSASGQDSEAISIMKSRYLLSKVIKKLDIQGSISSLEPSNPEIENAQENILAEWAYWANWQVPILKDPHSSLALKNIVHPGELKQVLILKMKDASRFTVKTEEGQDLGEGALDLPFQYQNVSFSVQQKDKNPLAAGTKFLIVIESITNRAALIGKDIVITQDRDDKSLLKLQFKHRDRHFAGHLLNTLMKEYQRHLEDDHELSASSQVHYLEKRQKEAGNALEVLMDNYVKNVSDDMSTSGFTSLQQEMDFLAANLASNQQKLTEIQLETKRLKNIDCNACVHFDSYTGRQDPAIINHLLSEIRGLKQQSDSLELALQNKHPHQQEDIPGRLEENFKNLEATNSCLNEATSLVNCLQSRDKALPSTQAIDQAGYPVSIWLKTYLDKKSLSEKASKETVDTAYEDFKQFKVQFLSYLDTFTRLMKIQASTMEQRMRTQQPLNEEFEGIGLETSRNLYLTFVRELNDLEAQEKQHRFVVDQLKNPEFELSSLTALLHDPISHERIANASKIMISLQDENNRTQKELERLVEELKLQKIFLNSHIEQMADLLQLKSDLLRNKITAIQNATLDLTHQQISLLKKHLNDYVTSRIENMAQEKALLENHQIALHERMSTIPPKWASEQLLNQNLALQQRFLENLAAMVESKNISKNLEMVQSSPLDIAVPPLHPKNPRLLFFTLFGAMLGFLGSTGYLFTRTMIKGIPASRDNMRLAHLHVSGSISPFQGDEISATAPLIDSDLDTLRRLIARYDQETATKQAKLLLIVPGNGPDFSNTLAKLLAKKGQTTLKLQLGFQKEESKELLPGLLQYLEGKADSPIIEELDGFDRIVAGGISRYSEEFLKSPRFIKLLEKLKPSYNWIIGVSPAKIPSAEAENLAKLFDGVVVVVTNETLQNLVTFSNTLDPLRKKALTFVTGSSSL